MRESWTDARLDDFSRHVDDRFDWVDHRFNAVDQRFNAVDQRLDRVEEELRTQRSEMRAGFESLQRLILQVGGGAIATLAAGILAVLATHL